MKKKLITILSALLMGMPLLAQNSHGNPFAHLGYEVKIATLTDFEEFHDFEDVVEIGQVLYDTKKREIVGFVGEKDHRIELIKDVISTSIDPHCEKYPWISPYAYCFNNPIKYVDPDGRDVWIYYEQDGKQQKMLYQQGMEYSGGNAFVASTVGYLNTMAANGGGDVLGALISSSNSFNFMNQLPTDKSGNAMDGTLAFNGDANGGGNILAGMLMGNTSDYSKLESTAHEVFHAYQHENGQGGSSIFNEIEAQVYSGAIASNWMVSTGYFGGNSGNLLGNESASGRAYEGAMHSLLNTYSPSVFNTAVNNYKSGSINNSTGLYNNYPVRRSNQTKSLLQPLYPLLK